MSCSGAKSWGGRRSRKQRGGNGYGFGPAITPGALEVVSNRTSVVDGAPNPMGGRRRRGRKSRRGGVPPPLTIQNPSTTTSTAAAADTLVNILPYSKRGGSRRRSRKGRKSRRRSMRGGGSVAGVGYGFSGDGARGLAIQSGYPSNLPPGGAFEIPTGTR